MNELLKAIPSIILIGTANSILKWRIIYLNQQEITILSNKFFKFFLDPYILFGALATILSITWWLSIISSVRIGIVYPVIQAGSIVFTLFLSTFFLSESINLNQFLGIILIVSGITILASTN